MKIQVLVAAMGQTDHSLLEKMNIQSDAIVANQCGKNSVEYFTWNGHDICYLNFHEKGVGLNRNNALMRADCDICVFADDDMTYLEGYPTLIEKAFKDHQDADIIIFNVAEKKTVGQSGFVIEKPMKVKWHNFLRYGMVRVAARYKSIKEQGIYFNQCFGGGCEYQCGEDCIFLSECLRKGLKIIALPITIAELTYERASTWNEGYTDKFFHDQGKLYHTISRRWWKMLCLQDAIRHEKDYKKAWICTYKKMVESAKRNHTFLE